MDEKRHHEAVKNEEHETENAGRNPRFVRLNPAFDARFSKVGVVLELQELIDAIHRLKIGREPPAFAVFVGRHREEYAGNFARCARCRTL